MPKANVKKYFKSSGVKGKAKDLSKGRAKLKSKGFSSSDVFRAGPAGLAPVEKVAPELEMGTAQQPPVDPNIYPEGGEAPGGGSPGGGSPGGGARKKGYNFTKNLGY